MRKSGVLLGFFALWISACGKESKETALNLKECPSGYASVDDCQSNITWPDGSQIPLHFEEKITTDFRRPLIEAASELNQTMMSTQFVLDVDGQRPAPPYHGDAYAMAKDGVNGIYLVDEPWPFANSKDSDAMTITSFNRKNIFEMDIFFRARSFPADIQKQERALRFARVMSLHEMLHGLGLVHSDATDALMQPVLRTSFIDRHLGNSDLLVLSREYRLRPTSIATTLQ